VAGDDNSKAPGRARRLVQQRPLFELNATREASRRAVKRARIQALVLAPLLVGVLFLYANREALFGRGSDTVVRIIAALVITALGWKFARSAGRALAPVLLHRMDPATAGTAGFLVRLSTMLVVVVVALRVAGIGPDTLVLGGAFTAVVFGLAAQQTLGNLIAGTVLASAQPFRAGERVKLQGGGLAGVVEGVVSSLGLLYTTLSSGEDAIMVPNSIVLSSAVVPLREPAGVDVRARLRPGVTPVELERVLRESVQTPMRGPPRVLLEEMDADEIVVRIVATPARSTDGPILSSEVLATIAPLTARARVTVTTDREEADGAPDRPPDRR
jgi:small conductance mechanosensitive channel